MSISSISGSSLYNYQPAVNKTGNSFSANMQQSVSNSSLSQNSMQEVEDYFNESPAQRMFDNFLSAHHISKAEYNSMTDAQKKKIQDEFKLEMENKMKQKLGVNTGPSTGGVNVVA